MIYNSEKIKEICNSEKIKKDFHKFCDNHRSCKSCPYVNSGSCEIEYIGDYLHNEFEELKATELRREYFKGFIAGYEKAYYERGTKWQ